jgi:hypothetical protein
MVKCIATGKADGKPTRDRLGNLPLAAELPRIEKSSRAGKLAVSANNATTLSEVEGVEICKVRKPVDGEFLHPAADARLREDVIEGGS